MYETQYNPANTTSKPPDIDVIHGGRGTIIIYPQREIYTWLQALDIGGGGM